jgi:CheY-like chemotaxis protein
MLPEFSGPVTGGDETILVVEDDAQVRETVVALLSELGYTVLKSSDATSALSILQSGVPIDLLFTDVVMPGTVKTTEMVRQARALQPAMKVLYTSGYTQNAIIHGGRLDAGVELLSKPYRREKLAGKVRQLLGTPDQMPASAPAGLRVLLVEDDVQARELYRAILVAAGFQADEAGTAHAALDLLARERYDAAVVDYSLPDLDGLALARRIADGHPDVAIVFASGYGNLVAGMSRLAARVLTKPFTDLQLKQALLAAVAERDPASRCA